MCITFASAQQGEKIEIFRVTFMMWWLEITFRFRQTLIKKADLQIHETCSTFCSVADSRWRSVSSFSFQYIQFDDFLETRNTKGRKISARPWASEFFISIINENDTHFLLVASFLPFTSFFFSFRYFSFETMLCIRCTVIILPSLFCIYFPRKTNL